MQRLVFDEPYEFIPPYRGTFWSWAFRFYLPRFMRQWYGVEGWTTSGIEHLRRSLNADDGIVLCPNHSRSADPMLSGAITTAAPCHVYAMASWHVFKQSWLETFVCRRAGAFSVYREGTDRRALETAIEIVSTAERPLIIYPEGGISAANDRLMSLMDGTAFVARMALKKRLKAVPDSRVVVHPVAYRYQFTGDPDKLLPPVLSRLERRVFWQTQDDLTVPERIEKLRCAVQAARETQILGRSLEGCAEDRMGALVEFVLQPYEKEWLGAARTGDVISRVKDLRIAILEDMVKNAVDAAERQRRWRHLTDLYYAQCMSLHVKGYLDPNLPRERFHHRLFETMERMEEELTDQVTVYGGLHVEVRVGEAIVVEESRRRGRGDDPLMTD
ncbi:MAG: 1-acyl-sn-glycerol-3-phosphate acyltransferase, partial [Planctomycetaceae bacterium]|nr:1-acyl-sn-glycerol-3-phosphate acyltransferase [Planctomycetaceae bacterium]